MSGPQRISAEAFAVEQLREEPNLDYATLRDRARTAGLSLQPIHYGRARKQLGLPALRDSRLEPVAVRERAEAPPAPSVEPEALDVDADENGESGKGGELVEADVPTAAEPANDTEAAAATDIVAPRRKGSAAFDFLVQELRKTPHASYADLRHGAQQRGFSIAPIMYGRAKAVLGLVPVKPRGSKTAGRAPMATAAPLQLKQVESVAADKFAKKLDEVRSLEQLVAIVKDLDGERRRLRQVLERVVDIIDEALNL